MANLKNDKYSVDSSDLSKIVCTYQIVWNDNKYSVDSSDLSNILCCTVVFPTGTNFKWKLQFFHNTYFKYTVINFK